MMIDGTIAVGTQKRSDVPEPTTADLIDRAPWTRLQKGILAIIALTIVFDGFDAQIIGFCIPAIIDDWKLSRAALSSAVAAGVIGMMVGSILVGPVVDQLGRRRTLIGAVLLYGLATLAAAASPGLAALVALRFVAGLGIGAALPTATTIAAEFTPLRYRTAAIITAIVCVPLGGMLAGLAARSILPAFGWRGMFVLGGLLPVVLTVLLFRVLPESPSWLALKPGRAGEVLGILRRLGIDVPEGGLQKAKVDQTLDVRSAASRIVSGGMFRSTVSLWSMCFLAMLTVYSTFNWLPAFLKSAGLPSVSATDMLTVYNLGGVIGSFVCALAITRFGSRRTLSTIAAMAGVTAYAASQVDPTTHVAVLSIFFALNGSCVNALQAAIYALCAHTYATNVRGFGTALTLAIGRIGAICSAAVGVVFAGGDGLGGFLIFSAACMFVITILLAMFDRHIAAVAAR